MPHKSTEVLQKYSQALAKKVRAMPSMTDELYNLLTTFHARLKILEQASPDSPDWSKWTLAHGYPMTILEHQQWHAAMAGMATSPTTESSTKASHSDAKVCWCGIYSQELHRRLEMSNGINHKWMASTTQPTPQSQQYRPMRAARDLETGDIIPERVRSQPSAPPATQMDIAWEETCREWPTLMNNLSSSVGFKMGWEKAMASTRTKT